MKSIEFEEEIIHTDKREEVNNTGSSLKKTISTKNRIVSSNSKNSKKININFTNHNDINNQVIQNNTAEINPESSNFNLDDNTHLNYVFRVEDDNYKLDKEVFKILYPYVNKLKQSFIESNVSFFIKKINNKKIRQKFT
jgi:hypothetical protein